MGILAGDYIHRQHRQHVPEHTSWLWLGPGSHCRDELLREFMVEWAPGLLRSPDSQCGRVVDTGPPPEREEKNGASLKGLFQTRPWVILFPMLCWILLLTTACSMVCVGKAEAAF